MQLVKFDRIRNGMIFYSQVSKAAHMGGVGIKAGSVNDPPSKRGLAHLAEHVIFGGHDPESDRDIDINYYERYMGGPESGALVQTGHTYTFYGTDQLLRRSHILDCFDRLSQQVMNRRITAVATEREKAAVHNEFYRNGSDYIPDILGVHLRKLIYTTNPVKNRVDCELPEFEKITASDIRGFVRKWYVPRNMFAILFGPQFLDVKRRVEKNFEGIEIPSEPRLEFDRADCTPSFAEVRSKNIFLPRLNQHHVAMGFPTETFNSKDSEALDVLARILAFRLRMRIRNGNQDFRRGVYRVMAYTERTYLHGMFYIVFATVGSAEYAREVEGAILDEINKLKKDLTLSDEFDAIRKNIEWQYRLIFRDAPGVLAGMVIDCAANGDEELAGLHSFIPNLRRVTQRKLREVVNKYFSAGFARICISPE